MTRRILVTGASIAGCAAAWWLTRRGFDVTVVEQAPGFRDGGHNVDVRGVGREVLRLMDLEQAVRDSNTGERGVAFVDADDRVVAQFDVGDFAGEGPTAELEVLRGDLARLLYEATGREPVFRFGRRIAAVEQTSDAARVTFNDGSNERYDLIVVAEGVGSATRELLFPNQNHPRWMNLATAFYTVPRAATDSAIARWYNAPGGRSAGVRPDNKGTTRAFLNLQGPPRGLIGQSAEQQKAFLRDCFADAGWEVPRLLAGMDAAADFYFDDLRQVKMDAWSRGRVVLTGDAAWCVTPLGGVGAMLALVGAYVLAGELSRANDTAQAFAAYERTMRPLVAKAQGVPKLVPRLAHPQTRAGIAVLRAVQRVVAAPAVRDLAGRVFTPAAGAFALPDYD